jgi:ATP-dependent DNA ligase
MPIAAALSAAGLLEPPPGRGVHEIKHDGFRVIARNAGDRVNLYSRQATT